MNRAVFLDRDGTMIAEKNYLCRPEDVEIFPATPAGLKRLAGAGYKLFIVSNQSGVGRGYFTMADVDRVNGHSAANWRATACASRKFTSRRKNPATRAVAANRRRSFCSTRATNSAWIWRKVT